MPNDPNQQQLRNLLDRLRDVMREAQSLSTDVRQQLAERARERGLTSRPVNVAGSLAHLGSPSSLASK